eukprot:Rhum_TRINITY_DN14746_c25_g1::Rhum_TRINITY_DN14746_c25_g1_i1::g.115298::m.115298
MNAWKFRSGGAQINKEGKIISKDGERRPSAGGHQAWKRRASYGDEVVDSGSRLASASLTRRDGGGARSHTARPTASSGWAAAEEPDRAPQGWAGETGRDATYDEGVGASAATSSSSPAASPAETSEKYKDLCYLHVVASGDTLATVSLRYSASLSVVASVNQLRTGSPDVDPIECLPQSAVVVVPVCASDECVAQCMQLNTDDAFLEAHRSRLPPSFCRPRPQPSATSTTRGGNGGGGTSSASFADDLDAFNEACEYAGHDDSYASPPPPQATRRAAVAQSQAKKRSYVGAGMNALKGMYRAAGNAKKAAVSNSAGYASSKKAH